MSHILITGAAGFLGSHLSEHYLSQGNSVVGVDNFISGQKTNVQFLQARYGALFQFVEADVSAPWTWSNTLASRTQINLIYHLASPASPPHYIKHPRETLLVNSLGLANALDFSRQHRARVVFSSTSEVYGDPLIHPQKESYFGNVNSYGVRSCYDEAKRFGEALIFSENFQSSQEPRHGLVRIFNTYGPRMNLSDGRVIINFLTQAFQNKPLTIYGSGQQTRSFCYVSDLISGLVAYGESQLNQPVNLGNDTEFTVLQAAELVKNLFPDRKLELKFMEKTQDDPQQRKPDLSLAKKLLRGWQPRVPLSEGLQHMLLWMRNL